MEKAIKTLYTPVPNQQKIFDLRGKMSLSGNYPYFRKGRIKNFRFLTSEESPYGNHVNGLKLRPSAKYACKYKEVCDPSLLENQLLHQL